MASKILVKCTNTDWPPHMRWADPLNLVSALMLLPSAFAPTYHLPQIPIVGIGEFIQIITADPAHYFRKNVLISRRVCISFLKRHLNFTSLFRLRWPFPNIPLVDILWGLHWCHLPNIRKLQEHVLRFTHYNILLVPEELLPTIPPTFALTAWLRELGQNAGHRALRPRLRLFPDHTRYVPAPFFRLRYFPQAVHVFWKIQYSWIHQPFAPPDCTGATRSIVILFRRPRNGFFYISSKSLWQKQLPKGLICQCGIGAYMPKE